jgi:hypothetical protein
MLRVLHSPFASGGRVASQIRHPQAVERAPRIGHYDSQVGGMRLSGVLSSSISSSRTFLVVRSWSMSSVRPHSQAMGEILRSRSVDAYFSYLFSPHS